MNVRHFIANILKTFFCKSIVRRSPHKYSYQEMCQDLHKLSGRYSQILQLSSLATTADGNMVYCVKLGSTSAKNKIVIQASMHAREWLNSQLLMLMIDNICQKYNIGKYEEKSYADLFRNTCFYIIPMANPDGVNISQFGLKGLHSKELQKKVRKIARGKYRTWKANANGIDLNRNFEPGFASKKQKKITGENYAGKKPLSEVESRALYNLILRVNPKMVINYHETGRLIYYRHKTKLISIIHKKTHYTYCFEQDKPNGNFGDWLTKEHIDWCTLETCIGNAPVSTFFIKCIWKENKEIIQAIARYFYFEE